MPRIKDCNKDIKPNYNWVYDNLKTYGNCFVNIFTHRAVNWDELKEKLHCEEFHFAYDNGADLTCVPGYIVTAIYKK